MHKKEKSSCGAATPTRANEKNIHRNNSTRFFKNQELREWIEDIGAFLSMSLCAGAISAFLIIVGG